MASYLIQNFLDNNYLTYKDEIAISSPEINLTIEELYFSSNRLANSSRVGKRQLSAPPNLVSFNSRM